jgi:uncharacterized membrane protein
MRLSYTAMKEYALTQLGRNKWDEAVGLCLVYGLISGIASIVPLGSLVVGGPLTLGMTSYFLLLSRNQNPTFNNLFSGFQNFGNAFLAMLLMTLVILLGFILLIIPGCIFALGLSQTFRVMHDEPQISAVDAMKKSWEIMKGHKGDYFIFNLSFIGWAFLCILTVGIGFLFLIPYINASNAKFYDEITGRGTEEIDSIGQDLGRI